MKKIIRALILGVLLIPAANAAEQDSAAAVAAVNSTESIAAKNSDLEKQLENAIQAQLQAMKSTLPMSVSPGVVWQDITITPEGLDYVYQIDIEQMLAALPESLRKGFDSSQSQDIITKIKTEMCPQIKPMLCLSLDLMSTFSPRLNEIAATYTDKSNQTFHRCRFVKDECAELIAQYNQTEPSAE